MVVVHHKLCAVAIFTLLSVLELVRSTLNTVTGRTATGYRAFNEEYRVELQHPSFYPNQQHGDDFHDLIKEQTKFLSHSSGCLTSLPQGLVEFTDYGVLNDLPFQDPFVVSPAHPGVVGHAHFSFLDAYGARLKQGVLEVLVSDGSGFQTKEEGWVDGLSMHYETSALGYGRGDSQALAPPLNVHAVTKDEVAQELSGGNACYCDAIVPHKVTYAMGLLYYPQYGHTLFNGLSNMVATLWRKGISYSDVEFSVELTRNTSTLVEGVPAKEYRLKWYDMFDEVFGFFSAEISQWPAYINYSVEMNQTVCFPRILVGALPHLDMMNVSVPSRLWNKFSCAVISKMYWEELRAQKVIAPGPLISSPHDVTEEQLNGLSPIQYSDNHTDDMLHHCAVTIVTREDMYNTGKGNFRSIINVQEMVDLATSRGCRVQVISFEKLSLKEQIGQVRWNTTLLVAVDGSALLNTIFMHECSTVMYVEMWRRTMMMPKFEPAVWRGFSPRASETTFVDTSDPIARSLAALIEAFTASGLDNELESLDLNTLIPFQNKYVEDFLRNKQSTYVNLDMFEQILMESIEYNKKCRLAQTHASENDKSV